MRSCHLFCGAIALFLVACTPEQPAELTGSVVEYGQGPSGEPLRGILYRPGGAGPHPAILYSHGSAPGSWSNEAFEAIAPAFTRHGWMVFAPYRRGQGLSGKAGPFLGDQIAKARRSGGAEEAQARLAQLLASGHMADQTRAFAWLSRQPSVDRRRIASMGNSFGGIIALLSADSLDVCAAVDASGGAESWNEAPALRRLMGQAALHATPPIMFFQAGNDFNTAPSEILAAARHRAGKPVKLRIYPRFGESARDGHAFSYRGVSIWANDVLAFLDRACP